MSRNNKAPVTPVRAIFHDVLPAQRRDLPSWLRKPANPNLGSSLPPQSAAALLHATHGKKPQLNDPEARSKPSESPPTQSRPPHGDPLLEARMQSATLAAEVSESWRPPAMSGGLDRHHLLERELGELRHAIISLKRAENDLLEQLTPSLLRLARLIAERVLESEALKDPELPERLVREGLASLNHNGQIVIVLGSAFSHAVERLQMFLEQDGINCEIQVLDHVSPFSCQVKAQLGAVDESLEARLDHVLQSFLGAEEVA